MAEITALTTRIAHISLLLGAALLGFSAAIG